MHKVLAISWVWWLGARTSRPRFIAMQPETRVPPRRQTIADGDVRAPSVQLPASANQATRGFTLTELVLVVFLLGAVAALAALRLGDVMERNRVRVAEADLLTLRSALLGCEVLPGYLPDMQRLPGFSPAYIRVHNLLNATNVVARDGILLDDNTARPGYAPFVCFTNWNPEAARGWRGPYLRAHTFPHNTHPQRDGFFPAPNDRRHDGDATFAQRGFFPLGTLPADAVYGLPGECAIGDPWGNPYVLQIPPEEAFTQTSPPEERRFLYARFVSAGPDGILQTPCFGTAHNEAERRALRLAGRLDSGSTSARGDDIVLFINRTDIFEPDE